MSKGVVLFASNNGAINYVKQARFLAKRIRKYMDLPTTLITTDDVRKKWPYMESSFDKIIYLPNAMRSYDNQKRYYDGDLHHRNLLFKNRGRATAYELSPYHETLVMDTDFIICNDKLNQCFDNPHDFCIYDDATHIGIHNGTSEFKNISDTSVKFYWATVMFFRKTSTNEIFFNLVKHIEENYLHYRSLYNFKSATYRNDFAFSIGIHIMNGYKDGDFAAPLPGKKYYATDRDHCLSISETNIKMLTQKKDRLGESTGVNLKDTNLHIMNKFSLERAIDDQ